MAALLTWSAVGGALHAAWLWRRLKRLMADDIPERIDGPIVLALAFIVWFCVPLLVVLMIASGSVTTRDASWLKPVPKDCSRLPPRCANMSTGRASADLVKAARHSSGTVAV